MMLRAYQQQLIKDTYASMAAGNKAPMICLPTGAGKTACFAWMAEQAQAKGNTVWFLVHRRELLDQTVETFDLFGIPRKTIHVGMVGQVARNSEKFPKPNLIVFDEAHHSQAATWRKIIDRFNDAWLIGLTATPARLDGKPLGEIYDDLILGPSTAELIRDGWLADYKYYSVDVADLTGLKKRGSDYALDDASSLMMQRAVYGDVIRTWHQHADGKQTIVFCTTVAHSEATAAAFRDAGVNALHFDGNTPANKRRQIIDRFRSGDVTALCNCDLISEGFDMPACEVIVQLRPTASLNIYLQQNGRALRPAEGKTAVLIDHVGNYTRHGLPDDDRAWNLNERLPVRENAAPDGSFLIRQCRDCFAVYPAMEPACPECGAEYTATRAEIQQIQEARLTEIRRREAERVDRWKDTRMGNIQTEADCNTYADLCLLAKKQGAANVRKWATAASYRLGIRRPWE